MKSAILKLFMLMAPCLALLCSNSFANVDELRVIPDDQAPGRYFPAFGAPLKVEDMSAGRMTFVDRLPWAMPHMAYKTGMLATRSLDREYLGRSGLSEKYAYFKKRNLRSILNIQDPETRQAQINLLSPAEKYDLLIGDLSQNFSNAVWAEVRQQMAQGHVPTWLGICDGSSAASVIFREPIRSVTMPSRIEGVEVKFFVGDIKALLSFSMTTYVSQDLPIFGRRCRTSGDCVGINPASLHQILLRMAQMNERREAIPYMIVDRLPNTAIWNSALLSSSIAYYDPDSSHSVSENPVAHLFDVDDYSPPPGSPGWAPGTRYLLYATSILRLSDTRTPIGFNDLGTMKVMDLSVRYVLEFNRKHELIGGEWLTPKHPGFVWALPQDYRPRSSGDRETESFSWQGAAVPDAAMSKVLRSSKKMQPLFRIIDAIYQDSL